MFVDGMVCVAIKRVLHVAAAATATKRVVFTTAVPAV